MKTRLFCAAAIILGVLAGPAAYASPIYDFTGTVTGAVPGTNVGDPLTGTLSFDYLDGDSSGGGAPGSGYFVYQSSGEPSVLDFIVNVDGMTYSITDFTNATVIGLQGAFWGYSSGLTSDGANLYNYFVLSGNTGDSAYDSNGLPTSGASGGAYLNTATGQLDISISSVTLASAVPEPAVLGLLGFGAVLMARRWRGARAA